MKTISVKELIQIIKESDLDQTIKSILIRDIENGGVNDFLIEQVIAYCENALEYLNKKYRGQIPQTLKSPA